MENYIIIFINIEKFKMIFTFLGLYNYYVFNYHFDYRIIYHYFYQNKKIYDDF